MSKQRRTASASARILTIVLTVLILANAAIPASAAGAGVNETRKTLERIEQRIHQTAASLTQKKAAEQAMSRDLATVERELGKTQARIVAQQQKLADIEKQTNAVEQQIQKTRLSTAALEQKVRQRLIALYKGGDAGLLRLLFSASSPARLAENYDYLSRIVRQNHTLLTDYHRQITTLKEQRGRLAALRDDHRQTLADLADESQTLAQASQLKAALLAKLKNDRTALAAELKGLRERAERLGALLKKLESQQSREYTQDSGIFSRQKGQLPWPVAGEVVTGFGTWHHQELGTRYDSQGIEIKSGEGTPIHAVWAGKVVFANWFKGYGELVIIDHGDSYYTLYAQAARLAVKVGDRVTRQQVVAYSGYDGKKTIYFEIRHGGTPVDPTDWLSRR